MRPKLPYHRDFSEPVDTLVKDGRFLFGTYPQPIRHLNFEEVERPFGIPTPDWFNRFRLKEWQAFQFANKDCFVLAAVYSAKVMALSKLILIDKHTGISTRYEVRVPPWRARIAQGLFGTVSSVDEPGHKMVIRNDLDQARITLEMDIDHTVLGRVQGSLTAEHTPASLSICHPFSARRALYSHKNLMPVSGTLQAGGKSIGFGAGDSWMIVDDHKGMYPYTMCYDWLTAADVSPEGVRTGFNLTDNQIRNPYRFNENCLWVENRIELLPPVSFRRPNGVGRAWFIEDDYGRIRLRFIPCVPSCVHIVTPVARTDYHGPFGWVEGYILNRQGERVVFDGYYGMGEQKFIQG